MKNTQKIVPHLWFDKEAKEAANLYTSLFPNSKIKTINTIDGTPSGEVNLLSIVLYGQEFALIDAGPFFKFTPAISFFIACETMEEVDTLWQELIKNGKALMDLGDYPFSKRYGWLQDRFGLSWQLMFMGEREITQKITPTLMFVNNVYGKAEEAINFYTQVFHDTKVGEIVRYGENEETDNNGTIKHANFVLENYLFSAMDSAYNHKFAFNEAISFIVNCADQAEIDYYWNKLSADKDSEQCGWLKDKYGVSWQIVPSDMEKMLNSGNKEKTAKVTEAFLQMKKFDLAKLWEVYNS